MNQYSRLRHSLTTTLTITVCMQLAFCCFAIAQETKSADAKHAADSATAHKKFPANKLAQESSPYLLLHAHNPVQWYPWGEEAFAKAKKENKPIFLSIGYSSCYWCHVMERKVFSNPKIAEYMNKHFVNVKVDREERPDVDDIYMTSLIVYFQAIKSPQGGGWPLSMFLTPEAKPFGGGTYFPPEDSMGRSGFDSVSRKVTALWTKNEKEIRSNADLITSEVQRMMKPQFVPQPEQLTDSLVSLVTTSAKEGYDPVYGGIDFNSANAERPKFPVPAKLAILQHAAENGDTDAAKKLYDTLDKINRGGIQDHLAGGFHRYSTDRRWHVPHFEKMLYDQSQLAWLYTQAWKDTKRDEFRRAAEGILDYVLRDFTGADGGFYSALDAETNAIEGEYYVWKKDEITELLGADDAKTFMTVFGMEQPNPFEHGYVLHLPKPLSQIAADLKQEPDELLDKLKTIKAKVLAARDKRSSPLKDDKVVTSWNGLMIKAFATAGAVFERDDYTQASQKAADFLLSQLRDDDGRLLRTWRNGDAKLKAYLDDYAFLVSGLLEIHRHTNDQKWLDEAIRLNDLQQKHYWSESGKGYFFTADDHEELIARTRNAYDNVLPSGNGIATQNLLALAKLTGRSKYQTRAKETLQAFAPMIRRSPSSMTSMAIALATMLEKPAGDDTNPTDTSDATKSEPKKTTEVKDDQASIFQPVEQRPLQHETKYTFVAYQSATKKAPAAKKKKPRHVKAKAFLSVDKLPAGKAVRVVMLVDIDKGWHINANPANPDYVEPTRLIIKGKHGTKLTKIRYPKPKIAKVDDPEEQEDAPHYYEGRVEIHGLIEIPKSAMGKLEELQITLEYQACSDNKCMRPTTIKLAGKVPVAESISDVKLINLALFPDLRKTNTAKKPQGTSDRK